MVQVTYPGVYVEEVPSGARPIAGASTSIAAFLGVAERGPIGEAVKVFNFTEYQSRYGGFLQGSFLSHAVYQFFNNGGTQCYIVRVAGAGHAVANVVLNDRATANTKPSLTIMASSPGTWANTLAVEIRDGTNDPGNEFDLIVYQEGEPTPLETFTNLSIAPDAANFVETVTASSRSIRVTVNQQNDNTIVGVSRGAGAPQPLGAPEVEDRTSFRIDVNGDGFHDVDLQTAIPGQVADLNTAANIAKAIQETVRKEKRLRESTNADAFSKFTCEVEDGDGGLVLRSGAPGPASAVIVAPAQNPAHDASALLKLGRLNGGVESFGTAVRRPRPTSPGKLYFIGDHILPSSDVASVVKGSDGTPILADQPQPYINAFATLDDKEDVSLMAVPGIGSTALVGAGVNYCERRSLSDCFFIGDMSPKEVLVDDVIKFRNAITPKNSYGAIYAPWVRMLDPTGRSSSPILVPPSGFVAGLYARTDGQRGVWKAPAGTSAALGGSVGLAVNLTDTQQGNLNPLNVNVIRQFASSGIVVWGARTVTADPAWNYIPVRRMAIFLRVSIYRGIQWAVFEPNDEDLWSSLRLSIGSFMMNLFRQGAFQGATPAQAFFVKCDNETTTQGDIDAGIVNVLVGFAPLKPAEFVIVKISQKLGQTA